MKALWFFAALGLLMPLLILTAHVAYDRGQQEQRMFQALCETPGIRCLVQVGPEYLETHPDDVYVVPYAAYEWRGDDGRLQ